MTDLIALSKLAHWQKLKTLVLDSVSSPITRAVNSNKFNCCSVTLLVECQRGDGEKDDEGTKHI